jgi:predicted RNase H-like HicB family nuclease
LTSWTVVYERTSTGWSAYVPALPGVGVAAATHEESEELIRDAIAMHLDGLADDGLPIPEPDSVDVGQVELSRTACTAPPEPQPRRRAEALTKGIFRQAVARRPGSACPVSGA